MKWKQIIIFFLVKEIIVKYNINKTDGAEILLTLELLWLIWLTVFNLDELSKDFSV